MLIYLVILLLIFLLSPLKKVRLSSTNFTLSGRDIYLFILMLSMTLIIGLRGLSVGTDTAPYASFFNRIANSNSLKEAFEVTTFNGPVFISLCWILGRITADPLIYIFVTSIIINAGLFNYIKKTSCDYTLSLLLYIGLTLFFYAMNGTRQTIAIVLMLNAVYYIIEDNKIKGIVLALLALCIHITAAVVLLGLIIVLASHKKDNVKFQIIFSAIIGLFSSFLIVVIANLIVRYFPHYSIYINGLASFSILEYDSNGRIAFVYIFLGAFIILDLIVNKLKYDTFFSRIVPLLVFGIVFGIINCKNALINRLMWYYVAFFISYVPYAIQKVKYKEKIPIKAITIMCLLLYVYIYIKENQGGIYPYIFY